MPEDTRAFCAAIASVDVLGGQRLAEQLVGIEPDAHRALGREQPDAADAVTVAAVPAARSGWRRRRGRSRRAAVGRGQGDELQDRAARLE